MKKVYDLSSGLELAFTDGASSRWCVAFCYCQDHNKKSWLFAHRENGTLEAAYKALPMVLGNSSIACGDYVTELD